MRRDSVGVPDGPGGSAPFTNHRLAEWGAPARGVEAAGSAGRRKADEGRAPPMRRPVLSPDATYDDLLDEQPTVHEARTAGGDGGPSGGGVEEDGCTIEGAACAVATDR